MTCFENTLVLVPHPDDEALMCAGIIKRAVEDGFSISVAIVTNGDYLCDNHSKGEARLRESLNTLKQLGVRDEDIYFLGYPDTGFEAKDSFLSRLESSDENEIVASTAGSHTYAIKGEHEDYSFLRSGSHAPYTKAAFCSDLNALLLQINPSLIITTANEDCHGDHSALCRFVKEAVKAMKKKPQLWCGMVHSPDGDLIWPKLTEKLSLFELPKSYWGEGLKWENSIHIQMPASMLAENTKDSEKFKLIELYKTALNPDEPEVCEYLFSFAKCEEVFWSIDV